MSFMLGFAFLIIGCLLVLKVVGSVVGLLVALVVAAVIGFTAEAIIPGDKMPSGWMAALGAGLVGSGLGRLLMGSFGPHLFGFALIPSIVGAMIVVVLVTLFSRRANRS